MLGLWIGRIVTAIDAQWRLGLRSRPEGNTPMIMVVRPDDGAVRLLVEEIGNALNVEASSYEPSLDTVDGSVRDLTPGTYKPKGRLLLCLDAMTVVESRAAAQA